MLKPGDVVLAKVQFTDGTAVKKRPAVVLFYEMGNIVVAGITSNPRMKGVPVTALDGAIKDSVIKTNYLMTLAEPMVMKKLFELPKEKRKQLWSALTARLSGLNT
ncbi:MAG: type II toxin-antitoxin system PemK/MazF family toxin [Candidatus Micrarchaeota archaeon]|nr:type II toxin-antitoxin system PemK/MazF family toxin [Candidatus Micrarchaeota archaeon]